MRRLASLGLTSSAISLTLAVGSDDTNHETDQLRDAGLSFFCEVLLVDPRRISIEMARGEPSMIRHQERVINGLSTLIVRGTSRVERAVRALVHGLVGQGCDVVDPATRFAGTQATKLITTIHRHLDGVGSDSFLAFSEAAAVALLSRAGAGSFPLLYKPIHGSGGSNIRRVDHPDVAIECAREHFAEDPDRPLLLQGWVDFEAEFRAIVVHGECLGIAEKTKAAGALTANAATGAVLTAVRDAELQARLLADVSCEGILGVDFGLDGQGRLHIIEANRSPQWATFERAVGFNVGEAILERVYARTSERQAAHLVGLLR